jgi:hypothetical protein
MWKITYSAIILSDVSYRKNLLFILLVWFIEINWNVHAVVNETSQLCILDDDHIIELNDFS